MSKVKGSGYHQYITDVDAKFRKCHLLAGVRSALLTSVISLSFIFCKRGGRIVRWCWINFQCRCVLLFWILVGQGPIALAVGAVGLFGHFFSHLTFLFVPPLSGRRPDID